MHPTSILGFGVASLPLLETLVICKLDGSRADLNALASRDGCLSSVRVRGVTAREEGG